MFRGARQPHVDVEIWRAACLIGEDAPPLMLDQNRDMLTRMSAEALASFNNSAMTGRWLKRRE